MNKIIYFLCGCLGLTGFTAHGTSLESLSKQPGNETLAAAVAEARYAVREVDDSPGHLWVQNPAQGLNARFTPQGLSMSVQEAGSGRSLFTRWSAKAFGYVDNMTDVPEGKVVRDAKPGRVEITREGLVEWYENSAKGLEHGFTLPQAPAGRTEGKPLRVEMSVSGDLKSEVTPNGTHVVMRDGEGREVLRYEKLKVWDTTGRILEARMVAEIGGLALEVDDQDAQYPVTIDPTFVQYAYLKASNTGLSDRFGWSIAMSGDTIVIGAVKESSNATGVNGNQADNSVSSSGAAYVFVRSGGVWTQQAYLKASNTGLFDEFGTSVAISGDTIVVGAYQERSNATGINGDQTNNDAYQSGAAYVFVRDGSTWTQQAYLKASNTEENDLFGASVSISGDTIVVGALGERSNATGVNGSQSNNDLTYAGAAYVFVRNGSTWTQQEYLKASNTGANDFFGHSVAISGDTIVVGARLEDSPASTVNGSQGDGLSNAGAAYVFVRNETTWFQQAYLKASNAGAEDYFGHSVAISGDTIVVGASFESGSASQSGAGYVFVRNGNAWTQLSYLKASNSEAGDEFGYSVTIEGDTIVVGAQNESSNATDVNGDQANNLTTRAGAAYLYVLTDTPGPGITLTSPKKKGKLPKNRKITIRGAASQGYYPLASYQYRLNKKGWKTGGALSGSYSAWRKKVGKAKKGRNTIQVRSFDVAGQVSPVVVRKVKLRRK